ncbi:conserved hypothetical protein [Burkholderia sp. 8Y]|uniref:hypothetical protein n=1 Tax=Burkholderia sp. 8Y TaxID=2653133 RepID=UPI0012F07383|nr:hypothetical protein [Burkholderia sp. 8Y]VXB68180.1 conserved hypothetical protein [Burkholderia sp. 8Y]
MNHLMRLAQWLKSFASSSIEADASSVSPLAFEPSWHGDHWQNLLSSPMDARRYVVEDWATPLDNDVVAKPQEAAELPTP